MKRKSILQSNEDRTLARTVSFFKALGDDTRLRILCTLSGGERRVGEIAAALSLSISAVSHQLRLLKTEGLVRSRREGKSVCYALDDLHVTEILEKAFLHVAHKSLEKQEEA